MKLKFILFILLAALSTGGFAQLKIGYTNVEAIISYMPEQNLITKELTALRQKLIEAQDAKTKYFQTKQEEYQEIAQTQNVTEEDIQKMAGELENLQREIQQSASRADQRLSAKQAELLQPLLDKIQKAVEDVAKEKGYTYILNSSSSSASVLLHGQPQFDITKLVFIKLGLPVPAELEQANGGSGK